MSSSRREEARTDETTLSEGLERNLKLEGIVKFANDTGLEVDQLVLQAREKRAANDVGKFSKNLLEDATTPLEILKRTLSVRSVLSTHSSFAERMEALRNVETKTLKLAEIGRGSFGTVYEIPGTEWCLKKTLTSPQTMWLEFLRGQSTSFAVNTTARNAILSSEEFGNALMPRVPDYLCSYGTKDDESTKGWFKRNGYMFPEENGGTIPGPVICLERIMPLPKVIRESLIRHYFPTEKQEEALSDPRNKACLCRPYLGYTSRDAKEANPAKWEREGETLQNFPLYLDILEELEMDPFTIARDMALGVAAGHWSACIDMLDVEFVIGSRPHMRGIELKTISRKDAQALRTKNTVRAREMNATSEPPSSQAHASFRNRAIQLWMIDFNKVNEFDTSVADVKLYKQNIEQLVMNTRATDGDYYPRVLAKNRKQWDLWCAFATTYIDASREIASQDIEWSRKKGFQCSKKEEELRMKRPAHVINKWMEVEATECGVSADEFKKKLKQEGWPLPGIGRS